jgi:ribonuclease E
MIVNAIDPEEVRIAILKDRLLEDFDIETRGVEKNKGNIYKGQVMAVEPALNAAFVHYGADKQGFLTANDVHPKYAHTPAGETEKFAKIGDLLRPKQTVLVQVSKDEVGSKGAVLTTYLSLAGRYLVLMPDSQTQGVSRKIDDEETRRRVREAAAKLNVPEKMGVIIRTAGRDRTRVELNRDLKVLLRLWDNIQKEAAQAKAPALIFKEQDVIIRALRDYFSQDIDEIVLDSDEAYDRASEYMHMVMPNHRSALTRYVERRPIFHHYRIEEQLDVIYAPKVVLPSGGSIVVEATEALVAVDVNSGKQKSANQEDTATQTNTEAAHEVARQLRLRDLGGIIVVDFIDMGQRKNQQKVERALKEALRFDKARVKIGRIGRNGTLEITRQRIRSALQASVFERCTTCGGTGHVLNPSSHAVAVLRRLRDRASRGDLRRAVVRVEPEVANRLRTQYWTALQEVERRFDVRIEVQPEHGLASGQSNFTFETNPDAVVLPLEEPNFGPAPRPEDFGEAPPAPEEDEDDEEEAKLRALDALDAQQAREEDEASRNNEAQAGSEDDAGAQAGGARRRTRKQPRRSASPARTPRERTAATATAGRAETPDHGPTLDMPNFELVELDELTSLHHGARQAPRRPRTTEPRSETTGPSPRGGRVPAAAEPGARRRRDVGTRTGRRSGPVNPMAAQEEPRRAGAERDQAASESLERKRPSLLRRLFAWGKKD